MAKKIKILPSDEGYDLAAADYDRKENYLNSFEKGKIWQALGDLAGKKVLDAGAGTGRLAVEMARRGALVTALDLSGEMLKVLARKSPRIHSVKFPEGNLPAAKFNGINLVVGDAENLPLEKNSFDWVVAAFLIVHLKNPARFFDEAYRVLKDGGRLLLTNINQKESPEVKTKDGVIKIESYYHRPEKVRALLADLAFTVEEEIFVKEKDNWINQILVARK